MLVGYLMPNPFYTYILDIYDLIWLSFMAFQPFECQPFECQILFIYIYFKSLRFGLVEFYGILTIVGYLMPNPLHAYILNI